MQCMCILRAWREIASNRITFVSLGVHRLKLQSGDRILRHADDFYLSVWVY